jgi:hypothetical protein
VRTQSHDPIQAVLTASSCFLRQTCFFSVYTSNGTASTSCCTASTRGSDVPQHFQFQCVYTRTATDWTIGASTSSRGKRFFSSPKGPHRSGAHPAPYSMGTGGKAMGCKVNYAFSSRAEVKNEWNYISTPLLHAITVWTGAHLPILSPFYTRTYLTTAHKINISEIYSSDQITCYLNSVTLYTAAVGTAWSLLGPPCKGQAALYLVSKTFTLSGVRRVKSLCSPHDHLPSNPVTTTYQSYLVISSTYAVVSLFICRRRVTLERYISYFQHISENSMKLLYFLHTNKAAGTEFLSISVSQWSGNCNAYRFVGVATQYA